MSAPGRYNSSQRVALAGAARRGGGFTLIELLITISIIAVLTSSVLVAAFGAQEAARTQKTKALIAKLDSIVRQRWEAYRTRRVPAFMEAEPWDDSLIPNGVKDPSEPLLLDVVKNGVWDDAPRTSAEQARRRLDSLRELMRMEMPERTSDIVTIDIMTDAVTPSGPVSGIPEPAVWQGYVRRVSGAGIAKVKLGQFESAECLYMIVMAAVAEEGDSRDVFRASDVRDTDGDGLPEFVDAWGTPIMFLRWPVGFDSPLTATPAVVGNVNSPSTNTLEIEDTWGAIARTEGAYVGGAIFFTSGSLAGQYATITDYRAATATFTCQTPTSAPAPFGGSTPLRGDTFSVLPADPFDAARVYPDYSTAETRQPTFAVYPLVVSAGPDKVFDLVAHFPAGFNYDAHRNNPFWTCDAANSPAGTIGRQQDVDAPSGENFSDNIHNHLMGTR